MTLVADRRPRWGADAPAAAALVLTLVVVWGAAKLLSVWAWVVVPAQYGDTYYYFLTAQELARTGGGVAGSGFVEAGVSV